MRRSCPATVGASDRFPSPRLEQSRFLCAKCASVLPPRGGLAPAGCPHRITVPAGPAACRTLHRPPVHYPTDACLVFWRFVYLYVVRPWSWGGRGGFYVPTSRETPTRVVGVAARAHALGALAAERTAAPGHGAPPHPRRAAWDRDGAAARAAACAAPTASRVCDREKGGRPPPGVLAPGVRPARLSQPNIAHCARPLLPFVTCDPLGYCNTVLYNWPISVLLICTVLGVRAAARRTAAVPGPCLPPAAGPGPAAQFLPQCRPEQRRSGPGLRAVAPRGTAAAAALPPRARRRG